MRGVAGARERERARERGDDREIKKGVRDLNHYLLQATSAEQEFRCLVLFGVKED